MNYIYKLYNSFKSLFTFNPQVYKDIEEIKRLQLSHHMVISKIVSKLPFTGEEWMQEFIKERIQKICEAEGIDNLILQDQH